MRNLISIIIFSKKHSKSMQGIVVTIKLRARCLLNILPLYITPHLDNGDVVVKGEVN